MQIPSTTFFGLSQKRTTFNAASNGETHSLNSGNTRFSASWGDDDQFERMSDHYTPVDNSAEGSPTPSQNAGNEQKKAAKLARIRENQRRSRANKKIAAENKDREIERLKEELAMAKQEIAIIRQQNNTPTPVEGFLLDGKGGFVRNTEGFLLKKVKEGNRYTIDTYKEVPLEALLSNTN